MRNPERTIGVLTASASNSAERELLRGVISQAQANGAHTAVFSNIYNFGEHSMEIMSEHHIYELIRSQDIDGLIVMENDQAAPSDPLYIFNDYSGEAGVPWNERPYRPQPPLSVEARNISTSREIRLCAARELMPDAAFIAE